MAGEKGTWRNIDLYGNEKMGSVDRMKLIAGENPERLAEHTINTIQDCWMREVGRPVRRMELELLWSRVLNRKMPMAFPRCPESEIL